MILNDGVRKDDKIDLFFDKKTDLTMDIIELTKDINKIQQTHNLTYFYAYEFKEGIDKTLQKKFYEDFIYILLYTNYSYRSEFFDLTENAVFHLDSFKRILKFNVPISVVDPYIEDSSDTNNKDNFYFTQFYLQTEEYTNVLFTPLDELKFIISKVTFNNKKALETYGGHKPRMIKTINKISTEFNSRNINKLSLISKYSSEIHKEDFIRYLQYEKEYQKELIENLIRGTDVLIIDDFVLPEIYLKETIRYINSINPNNHITVFSLMKRLFK